MNIVGTVDIDVSFGNLNGLVMQTFQILDVHTINYNVLLGRDFMKKFGSGQTGSKLEKPGLTVYLLKERSESN